MRFFKSTCLIFYIVMFVGCSNKINVDTIMSNEIHIIKNKKLIYVEIENKTKENIYISYDIKKGLKDLGYEVLEDLNNAQYHLKLDIVYASKIDKNSTTKDILRDINVNIGIGSSSGNLSVFTSIGSSLARILGNKLDSTVFQVVVDINIHVLENKTITKKENTQLILTAPLNPNEKRKVINLIEESIAKKIIEIFQKEN